MAEEFGATEGRLDVVVASHLAVPRADAQRAIAAGRILVDGRARPKSFRLFGGESIQADMEQDGLPPAQGPVVPVRYEDDHLLIVSKPAGMITHPTENHLSGTLVNSLLAMGVELAPAGGKLRPGIVHRLDAGTSGLMIVAKTDEAYEGLTAMMREHSVGRRYLALVRGQVAEEDFAVDAPLDRRGARIVVHTGTGRHAETAFAVLERLARCTLLEAAPKTGRTHQIRVHLSAIGHPVLGDGTYGGGGDDARRLGLSRPFLHSRRVAFEHPVTGERVEAEETVPADLQRALELARRSE